MKRDELLDRVYRVLYDQTVFNVCIMERDELLDRVYRVLYDQTVFNVCIMDGPSGGWARGVRGEVVQRRCTSFDPSLEKRLGLQLVERLTDEKLVVLIFLPF